MKGAGGGGTIYYIVLQEREEAGVGQGLAGAGLKNVSHADL